MYKCVSGTLVVLVPSSEGLVVAADSRAVHRRVVLGKKTECQISDTNYKIVEVARPFRTIISVPGTGVMHDVPEEQAGDLTNALATAPRLLDLPSVVKSRLERGPEELNEEMVRKEIPRDCQAAVRQATAQEPEHFRQFEGKDLCYVVVANYNCERRCSTIASFAIFIEPKCLNPTIQKFKVEEFRDADLICTRFFGETDYVKKNVLQGEGKKLIARHDEMLLKGTIRRVSAQEAKAAADNLIEAASEMAKIVQPEFGIGGEIDVVLLGASPEPVHLRWKKVE